MAFLTGGPEPTDALQAQEIRKSNVRVTVTYFVVFTYSIGALALTFWLLVHQKEELALAVFNGFATLAAGITGFWFGNRAAGHQAGKPSDGGAAADGKGASLIGPLLGNARRPAHADPAALDDEPTDAIS